MSTFVHLQSISDLLNFFKLNQRVLHPLVFAAFVAAGIVYYRGGNCAQISPPK